MRYKFRGKRCDTGEWVVGNLTVIYGEGFEQSIITSFKAWGEFDNVIPESVGQWTGKFDINGIEIYKGDIVNSGHLKADEWIPSVAVIEWDEDFAMFRQVLKGVNEGLEQLMDVPCEVIGNIIDSPELIEVKR